ncbi:YfdQ family protein [Mycolicibacterium sphagni]|uniref:YfdQ family protein n=1 Tax=Mycolicibacterium sphagni TaxID=1786 RepID=UPI0021F29467|nr:YfdQ family protein [Mycolicibacterium sphagni]MCV7175088.1 DUF2303 family protein [Mycolicibacterium sphagni]
MPINNDDDHVVNATQLQVVDTGLPHVKVAVGVSTSEGLQVQVLDNREVHYAAPGRAGTGRKVVEVDSFLAELHRRGLTDRGTLWGNESKGTLTAVYNDHPTDETLYGHRDDRLTLTLQPDPDWSRWHANSGKYYNQHDMGELIEELLHTITSPDQAELLEVIDSIRGSSKAEFNSQIERSNGASQLTYNTEVATTAGRGRTGRLEVPQIITLQLRPWVGHPETYEVQAWFRVRVNEGNLALAVKLKPTAQIIRQAWGVVTQTVANVVEKPVLATATAAE